MNNNTQDIQEYVKLTKESSMLNWYPKVKDLDIPQPKTLILQLSQDDIASVYGLLERKPLPEPLKDLIHEGAGKIGYPLFLRSDQGSGKHWWEDTCFVAIKRNLIRNLTKLVEWHESVSLIGLPCWALVFREYIDMDSKFKAFNGMPISPERRYFIKGGVFVKKTPYWPVDSIQFRKDRPQDEHGEDWEALLQEMNKETPEEIALLTKYAEMVGDVLDEYWSIDFCKGLNGKWYLIDMARGEVSWDPDKDKEDKEALDMFSELI